MTLEKPCEWQMSHSQILKAYKHNMNVPSQKGKGVAGGKLKLFIVE